MWRLDHQFMRGLSVAEPGPVGAARVLELADGWRRRGGGSPFNLWDACLEAFRRGEITFDDVSRTYRHAMIHAGFVVPRDRPRFHACPECSEVLDAGQD